jgi:hypothetical protein
MASFNIGKQGEFNERRYFDEPGRAAVCVDTSNLADKVALCA